ncbi:MAG: ribbon-helix-helix protein, CopG family [Candidatus Bipolaricaulis sp.]|nr:ribbon-helix-helix protein, CopG family [Candidatus Bipolaricaulis sp.]MDD5645649.1 ribbon-helix-helix protein, CopG family [Candidatus Bipolaricaulis sp.]
MVKRDNAISIYIPKSKTGQKLMERLSKLGRRLDRSVNYLIVEAILQYIDDQEKRNS